MRIAPCTLQSDTVDSTIAILCNLIPGLFFLVASFVSLTAPIDAATHKLIQEQTALRHALEPSFDPITGLPLLPYANERNAEKRNIERHYTHDELDMASGEGGVNRLVRTIICWQAVWVTVAGGIMFVMYHERNSEDQEVVLSMGMLGITLLVGAFVWETFRVVNGMRNHEKLEFRATFRSSQRLSTRKSVVGSVPQGEAAVQTSSREVVKGFKTNGSVIDRVNIAKRAVEEMVRQQAGVQFSAWGLSQTVLQLIIQDPGMTEVDPVTGIVRPAAKVQVGSGSSKVEVSISSEKMGKEGAKEFSLTAVGMTVAKKRTKASHRKSVHVAASEDDSYTMPSYKKTQAQRDVIKQLIGQSDLFADLFATGSKSFKKSFKRKEDASFQGNGDGSLRPGDASFTASFTAKKEANNTVINELVMAFQPLEAAAGDVIIQQGDEKADLFYVIESGSYAVSKVVKGKSEGSGDLFVYEGTGSFGELALLYGAPRAATVKCVKPGFLWSLERDAFRHALIQHSSKSAATLENFLMSVNLFSELSLEQRTTVANLMDEVVFDKVSSPPPPLPSPPLLSTSPSPPSPLS